MSSINFYDKNVRKETRISLEKVSRKKSVKILDFLWMSNAADDDAGGTGMLKFLGSENIGNCENVAEFLCFDKFKCDKVVHHSFSNSYTFLGSSGISNSNGLRCSFKTQCLKIAKFVGCSMGLRCFSHQRGKKYP